MVEREERKQIGERRISHLRVSLGLKEALVLYQRPQLGRAKICIRFQVDGKIALLRAPVDSREICWPALHPAPQPEARAIATSRVY